MCGIVGLHLRSSHLYPQLGQLLTGMLCEMQDRGSDSAGVAVYGDPALSPPGTTTLSLLDAADPTTTAAAFHHEVGESVSVTTVGELTIVTAPTGTDLVSVAKRAAPTALIAGFGDSVTVLKGIGRPRDLADAWELTTRHGWQGVGHTRMATESAVTPAGAHPYAVGPDQCLVHNGSFANHATIRRSLRTAGVHFDSANDTEVGARFVAHQLAQGRDMETALKELITSFDGFYTLLVSNADSFAVVRDAVACKPAVIAETDDWVAMASEYRALVGLPGIETARIYEPEPEVIYAWTR